MESEKKWELLLALYTHGTNMEALKASLPNWKETMIEQCIKRYRRRGAIRVENEICLGKKKRPLTDLSSVDDWYQLSQRLQRLQGTSDQKSTLGRRSATYTPRDHSPLLAKSLACIASLEDHPLPANPSQPNYAHIYRYLSQLLGGEEPMELDTASAIRVGEATKRVREVAMTALRVGQYKHLLKKLPTDAFVPRKKRKTTSGDANNANGSGEGGSDCPLFQDLEEPSSSSASGGGDAEGTMEAKEDQLSPDDPYFDLKREKLCKKVLKAQFEAAKEFEKVPGLNPLRIPPHLLVKPVSTLITHTPLNKS